MLTYLGGKEMKGERVRESKREYGDKRRDQYND